MSDIYTHYGQEYCNAGGWIRGVANECGCRGSGWWLSQLDTWHRCWAHNVGQPHPFDDLGVEMWERDAYLSDMDTHLNHLATTEAFDDMWDDEPHEGEGESLHLITLGYLPGD